MKGAESSQASGLPQDVVDAIRADKAQFDRLISENRQMEAAGLFNPYRVGIWNFVLNANVDATHSNAANLTTYAGAFFAGLRKRLIDPLFGAGHNTH